jgi:hypothetical protein
MAFILVYITRNIFERCIRMYFALMFMINIYLAKATIMAIPVMEFQVLGKNYCTFCNFD